MTGDSHEERQARSLALEKAYVHDVYDEIASHFTDTRYRPWPRVKQFLLDLEPASLVADVGCGSGKYLDINPTLVKIGSDHCFALAAAARARNHEVLACDNMQLPFRDETFDAVLSVAVIHHFATTDRRVAAIKELARVLRIGGKVLITVWAMEQRHRKFDSQDVLVPWHEPVKSSSEDRCSSVERELTSTTTSDDDVLVYHAYSHVSDSECQKKQAQQHHHHQPSPAGNRRKHPKCRNGRSRSHRSGGDPNGSRSSSELSSPNETCYSFVRRALQKLSGSGSGPAEYEGSTRRSRQYFYRSCRKPCISDSMEFGKLDKASPTDELGRQDSVDSEPQNEEEMPIELRHLESEERCKQCGSPAEGFVLGRTVCTSCLPANPDPGKKSRSLGDFLNMIPKLLRVKKCEKEPLSDLHKRISTASDPREYVVKTRGTHVNGIVRSRSTVSFMSRLEELMSMSLYNGKDPAERAANPNCSAGPRSKTRPIPASILDSEHDGLMTSVTVGKSTNPRLYNSPAGALRKLQKDAALDDGKKPQDSDEEKIPNCEPGVEELASKVPEQNVPSKETNCESGFEGAANGGTPSEDTDNVQQINAENSSVEGHLSSYYSMPELYKLADDPATDDTLFSAQRQRHISFFEQAHTMMSEPAEPSELMMGAAMGRGERERAVANPIQRGLVKRSLSVDTGDNAAAYQVPRRFSASAAQGVLASALRTYTLPRSCSRGSSVKSDTSVDSEESIVSVIPRKGNSITSDTSVDSEESVISVIQRSTSEVDALGGGPRNSMARFGGSRSAQASPVTVLSGQTSSSAESSPPQSGKNDGRFPGPSGVIDQLMQQQQQHDATPDQGSKTRRCLLRPITEPKVEEKHIEDTSKSFFARPSSHPAFKPKSEQTLELDKWLSPEKEQSMAQEIADAKNCKPEKNCPDEGDLSRTPSPVGPFRYITDPLITGIEPQNSQTDIEHKAKNLRFNSEVVSLEEKSPPADDNKENDEVPKPVDAPKLNDINSADNAQSKKRESEVRKSLSKIKECLESFASSQSQGFDLLKNVSHSFQGIGPFKSIKDKLESETTSDSKTSPTPKSLNDSRQSSLDESSQITLSDESVMSVEGTSSVSDEANESKRTDNEEEVTVLRRSEVDSASTSKGFVNMLSDLSQVPRKFVPTVVHRPGRASSFSDTELHSKKGSVRGVLKKRLRRSCVTIDEVECREVISSEDTSPSSSVSLEWNDFDKFETDSSSVLGGPSTGMACTSNRDDRIEEEEDIDAEGDMDGDVNVADTESKFNVFVDKEMCVFFETPPSSSSLGKSGSSSSNATDFSTTSDRVRGVMQREKSDDRSSKESDSDNLSKLSDLEAKSDSAFLEDPARRTEPGSSLDVLDSIRAKLGSDGDARQTSSWVLDNIVEIPDDDGGLAAEGATGGPWKPEDASMDYAQRRENFLSCAADCRDMYRISFDDQSGKSVAVGSINDLGCHRAAPRAAPLSRKESEESETSTDILAAFVETITDLTSVFSEVYSRQETRQQFDDASSEESVGISHFERVLTSVGDQTDHSDDKGASVQENDISEQRLNSAQETPANSNDTTTANDSAVQAPKPTQQPNIQPNFVELPPEEDADASKPNSKKLQSDKPTLNSSSTANVKKKHINGAPKLKTLNRSWRGSSLDSKDASSPQSTPGSPRMPKPRQRSVEEVVASSGLSRNSSLSLSTSQESLPGNDIGGLMSYHRYYHVFRQGELENLIQNHVDSLHIISSYYDHANWCVVAEKVQVWTI